MASTSRSRATTAASRSANLTTTNSVDRVGEFRVSTAPADAEFGRGLAQVQMIGRSGTNELHGSVFEFNRVTALSANDWFNNQLGRNADGSLVAPRNFLIRNQFGARVDAPIKKNKTFVFFLYEGQRQKTKSAVNTRCSPAPRARACSASSPACATAPPRPPCRRWI